MVRDYVELPLCKLWRSALKLTRVYLSYLISSAPHHVNIMICIYCHSRKAPAYQNQALMMTARTHVFRYQLRSGAGNHRHCSVRAQYYHTKHLNHIYDGAKWNQEHCHLPHNVRHVRLIFVFFKASFVGHNFSRYLLNWHWNAMISKSKKMKSCRKLRNCHTFFSAFLYLE